MSAHLTPAEIETLDAAEKIITAHSPHGASWLFSFHAGGMYSSACYFDSAREQHMLWSISSLSNAVQADIKIEAKVATSEEVRRAAKIARLKAELAELGEVSA